MEYKAIPLKDGSVYLLGIPNMATEDEIGYRDKIILELYEKIAALENSGREDPIQQMMTHHLVKRNYSQKT